MEHRGQVAAARVAYDVCENEDAVVDVREQLIVDQGGESQNS